MKNTQISTISLFKFSSLANKYWALKMMQSAKKDLKNTNGLSFYKLLGSGKKTGFNPLPDWSEYGLLQVWESEKDANIFLNSSNLIKQYEIHSDNIFTIYMKNISAKGTWFNKQPFKKSGEMNPDLPIAVITRATIKLHSLFKFWKYVPKSQLSLKENKGLIYTKGFGELPLIEMATFSLWDNFESLKKFAYGSKGHREAIKKTRINKWYKEELFARFQPYKSVGLWEGKDLLSIFK
jgi:hypothetical protein